MRVLAGTVTISEALGTLGGDQLALLLKLPPEGPINTVVSYFPNVLVE